MNKLDSDAVRVGALVDLGVLIPLVVVYIVARAAGADAAGTVLIVAATLAAPLIGGFAAGRRQLSAPLTNGAAAAALAAIAYIAFRLIDSSVRSTGVHVASVVTFAMLSVTLGMLGGFAGFRTASR